MFRKVMCFTNGKRGVKTGSRSFPKSITVEDHRNKPRLNLLKRFKMWQGTEPSYYAHVGYSESSEKWRELILFDSLEPEELDQFVLLHVDGDLLCRHLTRFDVTLPGAHFDLGRCNDSGVEFGVVALVPFGSVVRVVYEGILSDMPIANIGSVATGVPPMPRRTSAIAGIEFRIDDEGVIGTSHFSPTPAEDSDDPE